MSLAAEEHTVAIDAGSGHAIEPLGDVQPLTFDLRRPARLRVERDSAILAKLIAAALDGEMDSLTEQARAH